MACEACQHHVTCYAVAPLPRGSVLLVCAWMAAHVGMPAAHATLWTGPTIKAPWLFTSYSQLCEVSERLHSTLQLQSRRQDMHCASSVHVVTTLSQCVGGGQHISAGRPALCSQQQHMYIRSQTAALIAWSGWRVLHKHPRMFRLHRSDQMLLWLTTHVFDPLMERTLDASVHQSPTRKQ